MVTIVNNKNNLDLLKDILIENENINSNNINSDFFQNATEY